MGAAADPTYPLYPVASALASVMLLLVLTTSFVRQNWNLGVAFLCFWLFLETLTGTINHVIWSDNADVKLYVYCDIVTHIQIIAYIVKPMATLIITRRLYLISSFQSVELPNKSKRRWDLAIEWTLGLGIPLLAAGPIYYANQGARFEVYEGFGCSTGDELSILEILTFESWIIAPPLVSITCYFPKVAKMYYHQRKDINSFLRSNPSVSCTYYIRVLIMASIDILLTLPFTIVNITLAITQTLDNLASFPVYPGWTVLHTDWEPSSVSYTEQQSYGTAYLASTYFSQWSSLILAFVIFGLFGLTSEARASYWRIICTIGGWFGWKSIPRARNGRLGASLGEIEFGARPRSTSASGSDLGMGSRPPSLVADGGDGKSAYMSATDLKSLEEARHEETSGDTNSRNINGPGQNMATATSSVNSQGNVVGGAPPFELHQSLHTTQDVGRGPTDGFMSGRGEVEMLTALRTADGSKIRNESELDVGLEGM
ncbi:unnamed protein product [Peniophora sp. CBMAI 1063]|nr:unnamed protein product [Peniophora sp. CBMAI 1063]